MKLSLIFLDIQVDPKDANDPDIAFKTKSLLKAFIEAGKIHSYDNPEPEDMKPHLRTTSFRVNGPEMITDQDIAFLDEAGVIGTLRECEVDLTDEQIDRMGLQAYRP